jgi:hypothetical protein
MNPRRTYLIGLVCLIAAATLAFLNMRGEAIFGSKYTPGLLMLVGVILIIKARRA